LKGTWEKIYIVNQIGKLSHFRFVKKSGGKPAGLGKKKKEPDGPERRKNWERRNKKKKERCLKGEK